METIKRYILGNFEQAFVLFVLVSVAVIGYFIPYKIAFLNFYFIPILLSSYYLDLRRSLLGAFLCILVVTLNAYLFPQSFMLGAEPLDIAMSILAWGGFLILTGALVGRLNEQLKAENESALALNKALLASQARLEEADADLRDHAQNLERRVAERTESLEKSTRAIEELKAKVEEALYSTMDASVVKLIIEKRLRTEKRKVSVLFSDLKDFTTYSEATRAEVVITDLNKFLGEMESILLAYRAHIDKYIGDGIMAEFGAPLDYDRHALMAVIAGLKMQERLAKSDFPWKMRIGIATGEPIVGLIGHKRQTYTAIGDSVNLAERIEETGTPGNVTIEDATYAEVKRFVDTHSVALSFADPIHQDGARDLAESLDLLERRPNDLELLKKIGTLFLLINDPEQAADYIRRALELAPNDDKLKVLYAETSIKARTMGSVQVKGRKQRIRLYEVKGLKDPLMDRHKIPQKLYNGYATKVAKLLPYPEDIVLPVEALDGCIGHSKAVGFLAYALAEALKLGEQEKLEILEAGYLLDVGKMIVPHHLLNRSGTLSKAEFTEVTKHPAEGVRSLMSMGFQNDAIFKLIESHHEQFQGGGYPGTLKGEAIPLGARILAVADAYDALTAWRPYRDRWDSRAALSELQKDTQKGKFDPKVMETLVRILKD